jgi:hypothetical protein
VTFSRLSVVDAMNPLHLLLRFLREQLLLPSPSSISLRPSLPIRIHLVVPTFLLCLKY